MSVLDELSLSYDRLRAQVEPLLFVARDTDLQAQASAAAGAFVDRVDAARINAILAADERLANELLGLRSIAKAFVCELSVYTLLKRGESEQGWIALIDAQDMIAIAARVSQHATNLSAKFAHLRELERWLFPPQQFTSVGAIVREQRCSICRADYSACDHLAGKPYMGRICVIEFKESSLDHVALVEHPADRRCRLTSMKVPGGDRNLMTWVVTPGEPGRRGEMTGIVAMTSSGDPLDA